MIDLKQGDCLELMKDIPDNSIDLIVTDPPYLINYSRHDKNSRFSKPIANDNNPELVEKYIYECYRIMNENTAMYMFCGYKTVDFFKQKLEDAGFIIKNIIVWDKERNGMGDLKTTFGYSYEFIFFVSKGQPKLNGKRISDVWRFPRVTSKEQVHQNQKPVSLIEQCINYHSKVGDIVFDGFMGSGTTGVACVNTCRNFIGIELDGRYFEIAKSRISEAETIHNQQKII